MQSSFTLGRVRGIAIGIHYTWLFVFALLTWSLASGFFPRAVPGLPTTTYWIMGAIAAISLFASVLIHELAHSFVAQSRGMTVESITLFIFGGVSNIRQESREPGDEFIVAIVGPLSSLALAGLFWAVSQLGLALTAPVLAIVGYLAIVNLLLAIFNMIPAFPLDGGRVLRSIIWGFTKDLGRSTAIAAGIGTFVGYLFIFGGIWIAFLGGELLSGLWLAFIGWFLINAARGSAAQTAMQQQFAGVQVGRVMTPNPTAIPPEMPLDAVVYDLMLQRNFRCLPIVDQGVPIGTITLSDIREVPRDRWPYVTAGQVMGGRGGLHTVQARDDLTKALNLLAEHDLHQVPVVDGDRLVGILSRSDVMRYLRVRQDLGFRESRESPTELRRAA